MSIFRFPVLLFCFTLLFSLQTSFADSERQSWTRRIAPFRIVGNIYYVGSAGLSSYLIVTPKGHVLIDGGLPANARLIAKNIVALGFHLHDVKYLLNSHAHFDHAGGLQELKRLTGAQVVASAGDQPALTHGYQPNLGSNGGGSFPPVQVNRIIDDGGQVELGGTSLTAHLTPGHTKGCTTWTTQTTEAGKRLDVLFYCSTTAPGYQLENNPNYPEIVTDFENSFAKLEKLRADVFLAPHGSFFDLEAKRARMAQGGPNPFIDAAAYPAFVANSERQFRAELAKQR